MKKVIFLYVVVLFTANNTFSMNKSDLRPVLCLRQAENTPRGNEWQNLKQTNLLLINNVFLANLYRLTDEEISQAVTNCLENGTLVLDKFKDGFDVPMNFKGYNQKTYNALINSSTKPTEYKLLNKGENCGNGWIQWISPYTTKPQLYNFQCGNGKAGSMRGTCEKGGAVFSIDASQAEQTQKTKPGEFGTGPGPVKIQPNLKIKFTKYGTSVGPVVEPAHKRIKQIKDEHKGTTETQGRYLDWNKQ